MPNELRSIRTFFFNQLKKKTYKRLTRKDYKRLIGKANGKEKKKKSKARTKVRRKGGQRGGITDPNLLLAKMISNDNRNRAQREAMIDTMNKPQIR